MTNDDYKFYCETLGEALREYTKEAIGKKKQSIGTTTESFQTGYLCGFHRIITLMQQQAEIYDIPLEELGIDFNELDLI